MKSIINTAETRSGPDGTVVKVLGKIQIKLSYLCKNKSCYLYHCIVFVQSTPRSVHLALLEKVEKELQTLVGIGIIKPLTEPTDWVAPMEVVTKSDKGRLCYNYTELNQRVLRSHFTISKVELALAKLYGSEYFSKLDATSGFYQLKISKHRDYIQYAFWNI